jgi:hypothetical protein
MPTELRQTDPAPVCKVMFVDIRRPEGALYTSNKWRQLSSLVAEEILCGVHIMLVSGITESIKGTTLNCRYIQRKSVFMYFTYLHDIKTSTHFQSHHKRQASDNISQEVLLFMKTLSMCGGWKYEINIVSGHLCAQWVG